MIIHLGPALPKASSGQPRNSNGQSSNVPLLGLAPGGVCLADPVTGTAGALLPHRFNLAEEGSPPPRTRTRRCPGDCADKVREAVTWRFAFCCAFLRVSPTGRYPAPCPVEFGLSSNGNRAVRDHLAVPLPDNLAGTAPGGKVRERQGGGICEHGCCVAVCPTLSSLGIPWPYRVRSSTRSGNGQT